MDPRTGPPPKRRRTITIRSVRNAADLEAVRGLFIEYRQWLADHREVTAFADSILEVGLGYFDKEIDELPGAYGPPNGVLLLALEGGTPVGCGALREVRPQVGEIKRLYVRPSHRGTGLGRRLVRTLLSRARKLRYARVVLDTLPTMTEAIRLYRDLGFVPIAAYWPHPVGEALFFEYRLDKAAD